MKLKEQILLHKRNKHISFDKETHTYTYKGKTKFNGITSLISGYTAPFNREKVAKGYAYKHGMSVDEVLKLWDGDREYGNLVHDAIEDLIKNGVVTDTKEVEFFLEAMKEHNLEPIAAEWVVYDEKLKIASMIDIVCVRDGKLVIVDLKTMKNPISMYDKKKMVYPLHELSDNSFYKYSIQANMYKHWVKSLYKLPVEETAYILHINEHGYEMIPTPIINKYIKLIYEDKSRN